MGITPISAKSDIVFPSFNDNNVIKLLEKQKMQLQEQIQKTSESKLDDRTKQDRIKQLQDQIQQIDMEIQQKRNEKINQSQNQNTTQQAEISRVNGTAYEDSSNLGGMSHLIQASASYSQAKIMNSTKNDLNGKSNILKMEIKLDEERSGDAKAKRAELQKTEARKQMLDKKVEETLQISQKQVKEASKIENKNNEVINQETDDKQKTIVNNSTDIQDAILAGTDKKEISQLQGIKETEKNFSKIDIRV